MDMALQKDSTPGCESGIDCTWEMGTVDVPQPDIFLCILPEFGGQSSFEGQCTAGAPGLIVEISGSSLSYDLGVKLDLYRRAGVREYLTVLLRPRQILWRQLSRGRYREIPARFRRTVALARVSRPVARPGSVVGSQTAFAYSA